jgi:hypothetical protein
MNSMLNNGLKAVSCAAAAAAITLAVSLTFVQSTAVVHNTSPTLAPWVAKATVQPGAWFGQTEPAVLVD